MGWRDKFRRKAPPPSIPKQAEQVFIMGDIDVSIKQANGGGQIAELVIRGGNKQERNLLSLAISSKLHQDYDFSMSATEVDKDTMHNRFDSSAMTSLDSSVSLSDLKPGLSYLAICNAVKSLEQQQKPRELE